jgi:CDGSH-type Zn-finger protein
MRDINMRVDMARIVKRTGIEPAPYMIDGKQQWLCRSGLSQNQPFCDGSHSLTAGEAPGKLYWYHDDGERHEAAGEFPDIRAY